MPRNNDRLGSVEYRSLPLSRPLLKAACLAEAKEAQRKIDERHSHKETPSTHRKLRYSDEVVARARELGQTMPAYRVGRLLNIRGDTVQRWLDGTNRVFSAAEAKRIKYK